MREYEYLSEEALENLILTSSTDEVIAPSSIMENVLLMLEENNQVGQEDKNCSKEIHITSLIEKPPRSLQERRLEFRRYCMKVVGTSVAAFIVGLSMMSMLPKTNLNLDRESRLQSKVPSKAEVLTEQKSSLYGEPTYYISKLFNQKNLYKSGGLNDETK